MLLFVLLSRILFSLVSIPTGKALSQLTETLPIFIFISHHNLFLYGST